MHLKWIALDGGDSGDCHPDHVDATAFARLAEVVKVGHGVVNDLDISIELKQNGSGGALLHIEPVARKSDGICIAICWSAEGSGVWWRRAIEVQQKLLPSGVNITGDLPAEPPEIPWLALCEAPGERDMQADQPDIELATAWVVLAQRSGLEAPEITQVHDAITRGNMGAD